jgi:hypothetical protein
MLSFLSKEDYCGAIISDDEKPPTSNDFTACGLKQFGLRCCVDKGHGVDSAPRMNCGAAEGFLIVIEVPDPTGEARTTVFSRPSLHSTELIQFLGAGHESRWETLISHDLQPKVWKILLEHFPCSRSKSSSGPVKRAHPPTPQRPATTSKLESPPIRQKQKRRAVQSAFPESTMAPAPAAPLQR